MSVYLCRKLFLCQPALAASGSLKRRLAMAVCWPVELLILNKLLGLGGMDSPWLERISDWVENLDAKPKPKKKDR